MKIGSQQQWISRCMQRFDNIFWICDIKWIPFSSTKCSTTLWIYVIVISLNFEKKICHLCHNSAVSKCKRTLLWSRNNFYYLCVSFVKNLVYCVFLFYPGHVKISVERLIKHFIAIFQVKLHEQIPVLHWTRLIFFWYS